MSGTASGPEGSFLYPDAVSGIGFAIDVAVFVPALQRRQCRRRHCTGIRHFGGARRDPAQLTTMDSSCFLGDVVVLVARAAADADRSEPPPSMQEAGPHRRRSCAIHGRRHPRNSSAWSFVRSTGYTGFDARPKSPLSFVRRRHVTMRSVSRSRRLLVHFRSTTPPSQDRRFFCSSNYRHSDRPTPLSLSPTPLPWPSLMMACRAGTCG